MIAMGRRYVRYMSAVYGSGLLAIVLAWIYWSINKGAFSLDALVQLHNHLGPGLLGASWFIGTLQLRASVQPPKRRPRVQYGPPRRAWPSK